MATKSSTSQEMDSETCTFELAESPQSPLTQTQVPLVGVENQGAFLSWLKTEMRKEIRAMSQESQEHSNTHQQCKRHSPGDRETEVPDKKQNCAYKGRQPFRGGTGLCLIIYYL